MAGRKGSGWGGMGLGTCQEAEVHSLVLTECRKWRNGGVRVTPVAGMNGSFVEVPFTDTSNIGKKPGCADE